MNANFLANVSRVPAIGTESFGPLYYSLVLNLKPRVVVESGIYLGHTTAWIALACQIIGSRFYAIDDFSNPDNSPESVTSNLAACGVADVVTLVRGDAVKSLARLGNEGLLNGLGLAILDDVHTCEQIVSEFDCLWPYLEEGGIIGSHDTQFSDFPGAREAFLIIERRYGRSPIWFRRNAGFAMVQKFERKIPALFSAWEHGTHGIGVGQ